MWKREGDGGRTERRVKRKTRVFIRADGRRGTLEQQSKHPLTAGRGAGTPSTLHDTTADSESIWNTYPPLGLSPLFSACVYTHTLTNCYEVQVLFFWHISMAFHCLPSFSLVSLFQTRPFCTCIYSFFLWCKHTSLFCCLFLFVFFVLFSGRQKRLALMFRDGTTRHERDGPSATAILSWLALQRVVHAPVRFFFLFFLFILLAIHLGELRLVQWLNARILFASTEIIPPNSRTCRSVNQKVLAFCKFPSDFNL